MPRPSKAIDDQSDPQWFATTHWSVVLSAGQINSAQAHEALEKLCQAYWPPLYGYIRRQGNQGSDPDF